MIPARQAAMQKAVGTRQGPPLAKGLGRVPYDQRVKNRSFGQAPGQKSQAFPAKMMGKS